MIRRLVLMASLSAAAVAIADAAEWRFEPVVTLSAQDNSNVLLVDGEPQSDRVASVAVDLSASRRTERATVTMSYTPEREQYQDLSELDNTSHALRLGVNSQLSQRTAWDASLSWVRRERSRLSFDDTTQDLVALPRTRYDTMAASLNGNLEQSPRLRWLWGVAAATTKYDDTAVEFTDPAANGGSPSDPSATSAFTLEDSQDLGVRGGIEHDLSESSRVRGELRINRIDEGARGERDVRRVLGGWAFGRVERLQVDISAGAAFSKLRDPGELTNVTATSATDTVGSVTVRGRVGARGQLTAGIGRDVTNTLGVSGASLTDSATVGYLHPIGRFSELNLGLRYADRTPLDDNQALARSKTKAYRAEYRAAFNSHWALVVAGEKVDQSSSSTRPSSGTDPSPTLDTTPPAIDYQIFTLGIRWAPLSRGG